ncbi:helix-turn-helix transcriptional regulator [Candidatus Bathyarchaeota archaeon]|nr:helix-turn-helix transcriptional regulator [Candidatus Bathyarchaeota archaeon]
MVREPVERLKEKVLKENLWLFLFKVLENKDEYAYNLRKKIKERFGFLAGKVTSYKVLYLLEKDGYVESYVKERRKYYRLTEKGLEQIRKAKEFLINLGSSL